MWLATSPMTFTPDERNESIARITILRRFLSGLTTTIAPSTIRPMIEESVTANTGGASIKIWS